MNSYNDLYNNYKSESAKYRRKQLIQESIDFAIKEKEIEEDRYFYKIRDNQIIKKIEKDITKEFDDLVYFINCYNSRKGKTNAFAKMQKGDAALESFMIASLLQKQRIYGNKIPSKDPDKRRNYIKKVYKKEFYKLLQNTLNSSRQNVYISERKLEGLWNESIKQYNKHRENSLMLKIIAFMTAAAVGGAVNDSKLLPEKSATPIAQESTLQNDKDNNTDKRNRLTYTGSLENNINSFMSWTQKNNTLAGEEFKKQLVKTYNEENKANISFENIVTYSGVDIHSWVKDDRSGVTFNLTNGENKNAIEASYNFLADEYNKKIIAIYGTTNSNLIEKSGKYCSFDIDNLSVKKTENESVVYDGKDAIDLYNYAVEHTENQSETIKLLNNYQTYFSLIRQSNVEKENQRENDKIERQKEMNKKLNEKSSNQLSKSKEDDSGR